MEALNSNEVKMQPNDLKRVSQINCGRMYHHNFQPMKLSDVKSCINVDDYEELSKTIPDSGTVYYCNWCGEVSSSVPSYYWEKHPEQFKEAMQKDREKLTNAISVINKAFNELRTVTPTPETISYATNAVDNMNKMLDKIRASCGNSKK